MNMLKKAVVLFLLPIMLSGILTGCSSKDNKSFKNMDDFKYAKIGVMTGSVFDLLANDYFPDADKLNYINISDLILNLNQGKIDGILMDKGLYTPLKWENQDLSFIEMDMPATNYAVAFPQNKKAELLKTQMDEFIQQKTESGWLKELEAKWITESEPDSIPDMSKLTGENGILKIAATVERKPFEYLKNGQYTGFNADFIARFAEEYGYALEIDTMDFGALLPSLDAERYDLAISSITVTDERKESVLFSETYYRSPIVMAVLNETVPTNSTLADIENSTIGLVVGTNWDIVAQKKFPNAKRMYFSSTADMIIALEQGKIDTFFADNTVYTGVRWENSAVTTINEPVEFISNALVLKKEGYDKELLEQLNTFIATSKDNGTLTLLEKKWFSDSEPSEHPDYTKLTGENGTLKIAVGDSMKPASYQKGDMYTGYEVDFLTLFADEYGYKLDIEGMMFEALISSVTSGKCDIAASGITITPERSEGVTFTDTHFETYGVAIICNENNNSINSEYTTKSSFAEQIKESFEKTFIREDRWKLIVKGVGVTIAISVCSITAGTLLGLGLYMLSRSRVKQIQIAVKGFAKIYSRIISGTPVVVILMILFYVVFGKFKDISGVLVAIIGFSITFGSFVYNHMTVAVNSVDYGQTEAAYALGYTRNKTFFRIVLPQAMTIFMPSYCGQAVELLKGTAVVGYIAVNDLTKMGDIIRSNTYEAFFPLIATAIIYFLLTWILSLLLKMVQLHFEPKRRSKDDILKGVKTI